MKTKSVVLAAALMFFTTVAYSQFKLGIKAGLGSYNLTFSDLLVTNADQFEELKLSVKEADLGMHFGLMSQINLANFFIQPELVFNSNAVNYQIEDFGDSFIDDVFKEQYQYLDIPILMGARLGPFRLGAGPVGHVFLNSTSDLFRFKDYKQTFKDISYGWQAGFGLDLWKLHFDLRYEGNFSKFGDHITFNDRSYQFSDTPTRVLASVAISF